MSIRNIAEKQPIIDKTDNGQVERKRNGNSEQNNRSPRTMSDSKERYDSLLDVDLNNYIDPQGNYGSIGERERIRTNTVSSWLSISPGWGQMSSAIGDSYNMHLRRALCSLADAPSPDRRSSALLMSVNLQSMILGCIVCSFSYCSAPHLSAKDKYIVESPHGVRVDITRALSTTPYLTHNSSEIMVSIIGTSVLSIPFCVKVAGIWGLIMMVVVGLFSMFTADILSGCQYQKSYSTPGLNKRVYVSFVDMSKQCWEEIGDYIMKIFVYLSLVRNVVVIILLTDLADDILHSMGVSGYDKKLLSVIWTLAVIPLLYITKVSILAWVSFIGLNLYICVIIAVLVMCCITYPTWDVSNISMEFNLQGFGIATGIIINSYAVHMNLPSLEGSLKNPDSYRRTSCISFIFNIIAKVGFAMCGYLTYLRETDQEITSNINEYHPLPTLLRVAVMFFAYFTIPLQSYVVFELIDSQFRSKFPVCERREYTWLCISRSLFMTLCLFVAVVIPDFSIVVSLIGSLRGSMISLVLPAMFYARLQTHEVNGVKKFFCYVTAVFGTVLALIGVFSSVMAIAVGFKGHK